MKDINKNTILQIIATHLGVDIQDIKIDDSLRDDLHMKPTDIADLIENMELKGIDTTKIDLTKIDTVEELSDVLVEDVYPQEN